MFTHEIRSFVIVSCFVVLTCWIVISLFGVCVCVLCVRLVAGVIFEEEKKMDAADAAKALSNESGSRQKESQVAMAPPLSDTPAQSTAVRIAGHVLRTLVLDGPLLVVLLAFVAVSWCSHVTTTYLVPQYYDMQMTPERQATEMTYYVRDCTAEDLSTTNGMELFLPHNATPDDAYEHQLKHGFTVFRSVLRKETAQNLRDYVSARNYNLTEQESIFVIENENRYSFGLGTDEPVVAKAMKEVTTHPLLRASVEKIMGPNPALIEMTAITASYGAVHQHWHDDVVPWGSPIRHARAFGPSYSIFIQVGALALFFRICFVNVIVDDPPNAYWLHPVRSFVLNTPPLVLHLDSSKTPPKKWELPEPVPVRCIVVVEVKWTCAVRRAFNS